MAIFVDKFLCVSPGIRHVSVLGHRISAPSVTSSAEGCIEIVHWAVIALEDFSKLGVSGNLRGQILFHLSRHGNCADSSISGIRVLNCRYKALYGQELCEEDGEECQQLVGRRVQNK